MNNEEQIAINAAAEMARIKNEQFKVVLDRIKEHLERRHQEENTYGYHTPVQIFIEELLEDFFKCE